MKKHSLSSLMSSIVIVSGVLALIGLAGCGQPSAKSTAEADPVFFPPPPNTPRLQFLTSYSGGKDFEVKKPGFFEAFVLGEENESTGSIGQPFGIAMHGGKIYVCDVGHGNIKVLDIANNSFSVFPSGRTLQKPTGIFIEPDGTKYIADTKVGAIVVYNNSNKVIGFLGKGLKIKPIDVKVKDDKVYLTDANNNQVFVLNKKTGEQIQVIGRNLTDQEKWDPDELAFISCLALDSNNNVCVTDKLKGRVTTFNPDGTFKKFYGRSGSLPDSIIRGKGLCFDKEDRLWVADAGPANAVKVYRNEDGQLLMYFGTLGTDPGQMYMPAGVIIDYDHIELFKKHAVKGADLECLVLVANQYGRHKVSVYGLGTFPDKFKLQGVLTQEEPERIAE